MSDDFEISSAVGSIDSQLSYSTQAPSRARVTRRRQRKWHPRVFTGCANCRRRHVKCDEDSPACANCRRLSLACEYASSDSDGFRTGKFSFKAIYTPDQQPHSARRTREKNHHNHHHHHHHQRAGTYDSPSPSSPTSPERFFVTDSPASTSTDVSASNLGDDDPDAESIPSPMDSTIVSRSPRDGSQDITLFEDLSMTMSITSSVSTASSEAIYYGHFLTTVSTLLIIFDTPSNSNPYRMLPRLADSGGLLRDSMVALGAMHLANLPATQEKTVHHRAAMDRYGSVMTRLRNRLAANPFCSELEPMATTLLLCLFEKMRSVDSTWKVHLNGARQIFEAMYSPRPRIALAQDASGNECRTPSALVDTSLVFPMRRFLISLMAYLDVAAACATGEGTLIRGDYWETLGGGWEYNLGAPSFRPSRTRADRELAQIRNSWSRLMSIQADISAFAGSLAAGRGSPASKQSEMLREGLEHRIADWRDSVPDVYERLAKLDVIPSDASESETELLTSAACVDCYALACSIYLDRVATRKLGRAGENMDVAAAVERILTLISNFSAGLTRMAHLWSLFTAGTAIVDEDQKATLRQSMVAMKAFGFKHVSRALDILEYTWLQRTLFGTVDYDAFQQLASTALLP